MTDILSHYSSEVQTAAANDALALQVSSQGMDMSHLRVMRMFADTCAELGSPIPERIFTSIEGFINSAPAMLVQLQQARLDIRVAAAMVSSKY